MNKKKEDDVLPDKNIRKKIRETTVAKCHKFLSDKIQKVVFEKGSVKVAIFSHPQNQRMANLLDPELKLYSDYDLSTYDIKISVDVVPAYAACPDGTIFDLVIDHHKDPPNSSFKGLYLNLRAGSVCATVYQLIKQHGVVFEEDNDIDSKTATALLVGIITDTDYQTSDDTTEFEHIAYSELFNFRNSNALKQITKYKHPREWVQARELD